METEKKKIDYRWIIILVLLVMGVGVYFFKDYQLNHLKKDLSAQADTALLNQNNAMLKMSAKPLVWAVRSEMLRNNLDEINVFNTDLVKEKNVMEVTLLNAVGKIINSTDKKLEGTMAQEPYLNYLKTDSVKVFALTDSTSRLVAPVMGYQSKLGVLILNYRLAKFNPE
ncbi:MAG TPA: hypothetical protein VF273_04995 [Pelobium sp.]